MPESQHDKRLYSAALLPEASAGQPDLLCNDHMVHAPGCRTLGQAGHTAAPCSAKISVSGTLLALFQLSAVSFKWCLITETKLSHLPVCMRAEVPVFLKFCKQTCSSMPFWLKQRKANAGTKHVCALLTCEGNKQHAIVQYQPALSSFSCLAGDWS